MATRSHHARQSSNTVSVRVGEIYLTLLPNDWTVDKSYLYLIKKKILSGKIVLPSVQEKTGIQPFLLGYCSKEIDGGVKFVWN